MLAALVVGTALTSAGWAQDASRGLSMIPSADRVAIVIGNQDYANVADLANSRKDARDIAALLREFNFKVFDGYDLEKREFEELLRTAMLNIPPSADVVFYYAGHGIQIGRRNYLLPVDAKFESIYDVPLETMTLDRVIDTLSARSAAHVAILDSCRDNPFQDIRLAADLDANLFETRAGFDVFRTPLNSLIAYSTSPGAVASDGADGQNSPYTAAVLETARTSPFENIQQLFPVIREKVHLTTQGNQVPWESSTLVRPFYLAQLQEETESPAEAPETAPVSIEMSGRFDRSVPLRSQLENVLGTPIARLRLTERPESGTVSIDETEGDLPVTYAPEIADIRATDLDKPAVNDRFAIEITTPDRSRQVVNVSLDLTMNACDLEAGDALDLDGVGVFRLPNELNIIRGLAACSEAVAQHPDVPRFQYQLGRLKQAARQIPDAYANISAAAEAGHTRAKYALAVLLDSDRIDRAVTKIPHDPAKARALLEEGIAAQDPYAMHKLGQALLRKGETAAERERGFELLERAVELGHTFSMNELGYYFLRKGSDHYLPERGMRYLQASQLRKDIYGYDNLGLVALHGLDGNPADYDTAVAWFERASEGGHPVAPSNIARMIVNDQLPGRGISEAIDWYDIALERGDAWGGANGAYLILNNQGTGKNAADAAIRAAKAALLPNEEPADQSRQTLDGLNRQDLDRALQMLLNDLGENISVDGQAGPATFAALERVSAERGVPVPYSASNDPVARLLLAARAYWASNPVRFDLF